VAVDGRGAIVGCGELAPLSHSVAEVRSLVVTGRRRGSGVGRRIVNELRERARRDGYDDLCVFAHQPAYFAHMGFSIVPHTWLPEKISADCHTCALFRQCGQYAMVTDLTSSRIARLRSSISMSDAARRGHHGPQHRRRGDSTCRFQGRRRAGRHQGFAPARSGAGRVRSACGRGRRLHHESRAGGAGSASKMNLERSEGRARAILIDALRRLTESETVVDPTIVARLLGCRPEEVLVASTGVIGVDLDLARVSKGVNKASGVLSKDRHHDAARAIMTTDPWPKEYAVRVDTAAAPHGRHGERLRDDRAADGNHARVHLRCESGTGDAERRSRRPCGTPNAITVDGECPPTTRSSLRERRQRR
jgi:N-acetylglutamate synthase-like GNAT family acetyltransferase